MPTDELRDAFAVPYVLLMEAIDSGDRWLHQASYPELPGCIASAPTALEALELVDALRVETIVAMHDRGEQPPRPRPPLRSGVATASFDALRHLEEISTAVD